MQIIVQGFCVLAAAVLLQSPVSAQPYDEALTENWAAAWERVIDNALGQYLKRASEGPLANLDDDAHDSAIDDLYLVLYPAMSWDALGETVIESMMASCPTEVLTAVAPFLSGERDRADIDPQLGQNYAACAQQGLGDSMQAIGSAVQSKYADISQTYAKYGIDYP